MKESVEEVLRRYVVDNYFPHSGSENLSDDQDLFDTGILDSASALALLLFVEERFGISVPDEDFLPEHFSSVSAAARYIRARQAGPAPMAPAAHKGGPDHEQDSQVPGVGPG